MRVNYNFIKIIALLLIVVFLYGFSNHRNANRIVGEPKIEFLGTNNLFITHQNVSKLLIQNQGGVSGKYKEMIDLNRLETALNSNPMIKKAEVYMSVNGVLSANIEQRRPIARVHANTSYYVDDQGVYMPLSDNYSARVPLVTGDVKKNDLNTISKIAKVIDEDLFLKQHVIEIHQGQSNSINLKMRTFDFTLELGDLNNLKKKLSNFKAFYKKAQKDNKLDVYSHINLKFDSQVICTKK